MRELNLYKHGLAYDTQVTPKPNIQKENNMITYKILVLDIDGTLTNSKKDISAKTLEAILKVQEKGIKVVLASGRPTSGMLELAAQLQLDKYQGFILSFNGAKVINCKTDEIVYQKVLPRELIPELYQEAVENQVGFVTYEKNAAVVGTAVDEYIELEARINKIDIIQPENFCEYIDFDVNKCLMTGNPSHLEKVLVDMNEKYSDQLSIYRSEPFFVEIMPKNIDKAYSLGKLLEYLNMDKEEMIAIGDGFNDLSMIKYAGLGVAMANAQEVVKEVADYITLSNDEDGIVNVIKRFIDKV